MTSTHGLLTTVAYRIEGQPATYALEGAIAVTGSLVQWLRDNLGLLMQFLADVLDVPVVRSRITETTCLGAAYAAGLAVGFWPDLATLARTGGPTPNGPPRGGSGAPGTRAAPLAHRRCSAPSTGSSEPGRAGGHSQRSPVSFS